MSEFAGSLIRDPTDFFGEDEIKRTVFVTLISSMFLISKDIQVKVLKTPQHTMIQIID